MKTEIAEEYFMRVKKVERSKLNSGNMVSAVNSWVTGAVSYISFILDYTIEERRFLTKKNKKDLHSKCTLEEIRKTVVTLRDKW